MGKFTKIENRAQALSQVVASIDKEKFLIPISEQILSKNGWERAQITDRNTVVCGWIPVLPQVYNQEIQDWEEVDEDFNDVFIWYKGSKEAWCYKYCFGTYVYDIKSIGELEIILGREGFVYSFDI